MSEGLLTACVLISSAPERYRTSLADLEGRFPVLAVPVEAGLADETRTAHPQLTVLTPARDDLDPRELWSDALATVSTPWALLLVLGEDAQVAAPERLAVELAAGDEPVDPWRRGPRLLVPDPVAWAGPRLVRSADVLDWAWLPGTGAPTTSALLLTERPRRIPVDETEARWLRRVAGRRTRERTGPSEPSDTVLDAVLLSWAGEHDAAAVRAGSVTALASIPGHLRIAAARVAVASGMGAGRAPRAVAGAKAWLAAEPDSIEGATWGCLAASAASELPTVRRWSEAALTLPSTPDADPWLAVLATAPALSVSVRSAIEADALLELVRTTPADAFTLTVLMTLCLRWHGAGRRMDGLVAAWPQSARPLLERVLEEAPLGVGPWWTELAEAWSEVHGITTTISARILASAAQLDDEQALRWTSLMASSGQRSLSPMRERASSPAVPPRSRAISAALALEVFGDAEGGPLLRAAAGEVPVEQLRDLLLVLDELAPSALPTVVAAAATTPVRIRHLAGLLAEFGASDEADALLATLHPGAVAT